MVRSKYFFKDEYSDPDKIYSYEYKSENKSIIVPIFRPWFRFVAKFIPVTVSANLVSMIGNIGSFLSLVILTVFGSFQGREHQWIFLIAAFLIFFYYTLDSVDGMHARKIGIASPLGEFVDHWFDSFNAFMLPLGLLASYPIISYKWGIFFILLIVIGDRIHIKHTLKTNLMYFGPVSTDEGIVFYALFILSVGLFGYNFWEHPFPIFGFPTVFLGYFCVVGGALLSIISIMRQDRNIHLKEIFIELLHMAPVIAWILVFTPVFNNHYVYVASLVVLGTVGSRFVGDLLRARLLGLKYPLYYMDLIVTGILVACSTLAYVLFPSLPLWIPCVALGLFFLTNLNALIMQFSRTLKRIKLCLGIGLFDVTLNKDQDKE